MYTLTRYIAYRDPAVRASSDYLLLSGMWGGIGVPANRQAPPDARHNTATIHPDGVEVPEASTWSLADAAR
jgi:hypothetical protein